MGIRSAAMSWSRAPGFDTTCGRQRGWQEVAEHQMRTGAGNVQFGADVINIEETRFGHAEVPSRWSIPVMSLVVIFSIRGNPSLGGVALRKSGMHDTVERFDMHFDRL